MSVYSINEPWAPGTQPDADEAAGVLIGAEAVKVLRRAGIQLTSHYWHVTRQAVINAGGTPKPKEASPYWNEADFAEMF